MQKTFREAADVQTRYSCKLIFESLEQPDFEKTSYNQKDSETEKADCLSWDSFSSIDKKELNIQKKPSSKHADNIQRIHWGQA